MCPVLAMLYTHKVNGPAHLNCFRINLNGDQQSNTPRSAQTSYVLSCAIAEAAWYALPYRGLNQVASSSSIAFFRW